MVVLVLYCSRRRKEPPARQNSFCLYSEALWSHHTSLLDLTLILEPTTLHTTISHRYGLSPLARGSSTTSSQILLSRGVAGTRPTKPRTRSKKTGTAHPDGVITSVAMILNRGQRVHAVPASPSEVQRIIGNDYTGLSTPSTSDETCCFTMNLIIGRLSNLDEYS